MPPLLNRATSSTRPPARARLSSWVLWALAALALLVLLGRLQDALLLFMRSPINPDVLGFASDARQMHAFYDCPTREPFHVLWFKVGLLLSSDIELVGRVTTMLQTLLAGAMVFLFGRRFFGDAVALAAVSLFSINPVVRYYGVSGLRAPLFCAMLLLFALLLFDSWRPRRVAVQSILAGVAAGLLILTRVYAYAIVAGAFLLYAVCERAWRPERRASCLRHLGIAALALCLLVVPDILFRPASPIHGQTVNFFRNLELYGDVGTWQTDPPVSHFQYLFGDHTVSEVAWRISANYLRYAYQYLPFFLRGYEVLWWLLPVGIVAALRFRRGFVAGLLVLSLAPMVFVLSLNQVPGAVGIENRYVYQAFPLALLLALHGLFTIIVSLLGLAARRSAALRPLHERLSTLLLPRPGAGSVPPDREAEPSPPRTSASGDTQAAQPAAP